MRTNRCKSATVMGWADRVPVKSPNQNQCIATSLRENRG
jgi:hypothetical protein